MTFVMAVSWLGRTNLADFPEAYMESMFLRFAGAVGLELVF